MLLRSERSERAATNKLHYTLQQNYQVTNPLKQPLVITRPKLNARAKSCCFK